MMRTAVVISCEHGGCHIPKRYAYVFRSGRALRALSSHRGWDPGALAVAREMSRRLEAPLTYSNVSRLLVETNRSLTHPRLFSEFSRRLSSAHRLEVQERYYEPHRALIRQDIELGIRRFKRVIHLGIHSFTPRLGGKTRRADLSLLYDPRRIWEHRICSDWRSAILSRTSEWILRRNYPYRGYHDGLTTSLRRDFEDKRYAGIEIEINQHHLRQKANAGYWALLLAESLEELLADL